MRTALVVLAVWLPLSCLVGLFVARFMAVGRGS